MAYREFDRGSTFGHWLPEPQIAQIGDGELSRDTRSLAVFAATTSAS